MYPLVVCQKDNNIFVYYVSCKLVKPLQIEFDLKKNIGNTYFNHGPVLLRSDVMADVHATEIKFH